jgi:hypothetical protein
MCLPRSYAMICCASGRFVVAGGENGYCPRSLSQAESLPALCSFLRAFSLPSLDPIFTFALEAETVRSLAWLSGEQFLVCALPMPSVSRLHSKAAGLENGRLIVFPVEMKLWLKAVSALPALV